MEDVNRQAEAIRVNMRSWPEVLTWREGLDFAREAEDAKFFADLMVSWLLPTSKVRYEIRTGILAAPPGRRRQHGLLRCCVLPQLEAQSRGVPDAIGRSGFRAARSAAAQRPRRRAPCLATGTCGTI